MSETTKKPQKNEASAPKTGAPGQAELPVTGRTEAVEVRNSPGDTPSLQLGKRESNGNRPLTVEQYLRDAKHDRAISDLLRSLCKTDVKSFANWEKETAALLEKKIW